MADYTWSCVALASLFFLGTLPSQATEPLISLEEAELPPPKGAAAPQRGVTRGPKIELVSDSDGIRSPMRFQLRFRSFGGATIDLTSVKLTYLRTPNVDLSKRIKSFTQPAGIDMPDASVPPGEHMLRVELADSDGRPGSTTFVLKVAH